MFTSRHCHLSFPTQSFSSIKLCFTKTSKSQEDGYRETNPSVPIFYYYYYSNMNSKHLYA